MRIAWRLGLAAAVFVVVGVLTAKGVAAHAVARGADPVQVRLGAWMAGLFAGGVAGVIAAIALLVGGSRRS